MADSRNLVLQLLITAKDQASGAIDRIRGGVSGIGSAVSAALEPLRSFGGLLAATIGLGGAKQIVDLADAYTRLTNQLRVATNSEAEFQAALQDVTDIARRSNSELDSTAALYGKVAQNAKTLGLNQQQVADVTELVAKAMQLSGADAGAASGGILQFSQALASGTLRGDEFNSVMEASPNLMQALANGLGVAVGELRAMAEAGQLSADRVVQALLSQKAAIDEVYGKLPQTVSQAMGQLGNAATLFAGQLDQQTGATRGLAEGLKFLAANLDAVVAVMGAGFAVAFAKGAAAMTQSVQASLAASAAAREQALAAEAQQRANIAAAQGQVAAAQAAYNRALAEQRATQAQLAAIESNFGLIASEEALALARKQASAAALAATSATERYVAAQAALNAANASGAASAGLLSRAMGFLAGPGGMILLAVSAFASLYAMLSKQKPAMDDLAKSTDQFAASLERMNAAQLQGQLLKLNDAIAEQEQVLSDAAARVAQYRDGQLSLLEVLTDARSRAEQLTEAESAQADATDRLRQLKTNLQAVLDKLVGTQQTELDNSGKVATAYVQQATAMDALIGGLDQREKLLKEVADAQQQETKALLDKAKAANDAAKIDELTIKLAQQRSKAAQESANYAQAEAVAANAKVAALEAVAAAQTNQTPKQQEELRLSRETAAAKEAEAAALQAVAGGLEQERQAAENGIPAKQRAIQEAERNVSAARDYVSSLEAVASAQLAGIRAEIDLATAKGNTWTAQQKSVELAKLEAQWQQTLAAAKQLATAAEQKETEAKIAGLIAINQRTEAQNLELAGLQLRLQALGQQAAAEQLMIQLTQQRLQLQQLQGGGLQQNTQQLQQNTQQLQQNTGGLQQNTQQQQQNTESVHKGASAIGGMNMAMKELSARAYEVWQGALIDIYGTFDRLPPKIGNVSTEIAELTQKLNENREVMRYNQTVISSMTDGFDRAVEASDRIRVSFYEQALRAQELAEQLSAATAAGAIGLEGMARQAKANITAFDLLDDEQLRNLRGAIEDANNKLQEMQQAAEDARARLIELDAELAEAKGQQQQADLLRQQLDYQGQLAELEQARIEAQAAGNQELLRLLDEQAAKLNELNAVKIQNIENDARQASANQQAAQTMGDLADHAERAAGAMANLNGVSLNNLLGQAAQLNQSFLDLQNRIG